MRRVYVVMGVAGSGKTTVGQALARRLGAPFYDGDDFHPPENVAKMAIGIPLTDADRYPWLESLHDLIAGHWQRGQAAVIACSALKKKYRDQLRAGNDGVTIIYLEGPPALLAQRLEGRPSHYMKAGMLASQLEALEPPSPHNTLIIYAGAGVDEIIRIILANIAAEDAARQRGNATMTNPLQRLSDYGQSFWYDNIRRAYLQDGTLASLIANDGLRGLTSNPTIFEKAITGSSDYDAAIATLLGRPTAEVYDALSIADIRAACDLFLPLYRQSNRGDGYVSLEVSPRLARDTAGTVADARRLYAAVDRPNLMIKVPSTDEGVPAIRTLIGEGINVNVTLMFNMRHYEAVAAAAIAGLNDLVAAGGDPAGVASVASFFVSRVDTAVDALLERNGGPKGLLGRAAVANSKVVYQRYKEIFHGQPFAALWARGARPQRLLWASTGTKNPAYSDTLYIDELIGPETVSTMPPQTVDAFRDHGKLANMLEANVDEARELLAQLAAQGIDLDAVTEQLQVDGVVAFSKSFDALLAAIAQKDSELAHA
ncbi:MAG: transaldolase [Candidatus Promineofilum sp.]|nr:transaldolase [Promineifilum sp.]MCW5862823.1 transaldolase [Anaerolineae bacterium]